MTVKGKSRLLFPAILLAIVLAGVNIVPALADGGCECHPCPCRPVRSPGYWINHPDAWPVDEITIGGVTYSKEDAISWMKAPVKGDKTLTMFPALVAAKLNGGLGCWCIMSIVREANVWMLQFGPVGSGVKASSEAWQYSHGEMLYWLMDAYNNGMLCAPKAD